jgi:CspA family cold shock protein
MSKKWHHLCKLINIINFKYITMSKGTVKFFNESKGFGFITEEGVEKDHFVHISGLVDEIREGDEVEFDLQEGNKGLNAVNVKVI